MINLITTPLVAGVVGYVTNKIAIKMLFRPYKPKWYTLGWQGIVPKTRPKLANKISEIVGQKLLAHDDFLYALENNDIKSSIHNIIENKLSLLTQKDIYALIRLYNIEDKIIANKESINSLINNTVYFFIEQLCQKQINIEKLQKPLINIIQTFNVDNAVYAEIDSVISKFYEENKKLQEILPAKLLEKKYELADILTKYIMVKIKDLGGNKNIQNILAQKIINFKNEMFSSSSGMDALKAGFVSLFITDEKITNMVSDELPHIAYDLSKNQEIYNNIYNAIIKEIDNFLKKNTQEVALFLGFQDKFSIACAVKNVIYEKYNINDKIISLIMDKLYKYNNLTINEVLKIMQVNIQDFIKIDVINILGSVNYKTLKNNLINKISGYIAENSKKISSIITDLAIKLIKGNLKYALNAINIEKIVKDKINALPLPEVENILFSFMKEHFKWINILGFFIGFFIGLVQALSVYFIK